MLQHILMTVMHNFILCAYLCNAFIAF